MKSQSVSLLILLIPLLAFADVSLVFQWGERKVDDRMFAVYHQEQGPFPDNRTLSFSFEHYLEGKYFTCFTLSGEPLYVSWIVTVDNFKANCRYCRATGQSRAMTTLRKPGWCWTSAALRGMRPGLGCTDMTIRLRPFILNAASPDFSNAFISSVVFFNTYAKLHKWVWLFLFFC